MTQATPPDSRVVPAAYLDNEGRLVALEGVPSGGFVAKGRAIPDSWTPLIPASALTASESLLALTNEALAACQAQAAGKIRELEARLRAARYDDEVDDGDMSDDEQDGFCDCGALHSEGTEESDGGQCSACGGAI